MTYLTTTPQNSYVPTVGDSWPVADDDSYYQPPGGIYAPLKLSHPAKHLLSPEAAANDRRMQARWFRARYRDGYPLDLHYLAGQSTSQKPRATIVRLPGLGSNVMIDEGALDGPLREHYNIMAIDLPGCGLSGWVKNQDGKPLSPRDYDNLPPEIDGVPKTLALSTALTNTVIELVNHQTAQWPDTPVILCGHSMGALVGQLMLTQHRVIPQTVNQIGGGLLLNAFASDGQTLPAHWYLNALGNWITNTHEYSWYPVMLSVLAEWFGVLFVLAYFSKNRSLASLIDTTRRTMFTHMPREGLADDFLRERVYAQTILARMIHGSLGDPTTLGLMQEIQKEIAVPVAVLLGANDPLVPAERIKAAFATIPNLDLYVETGAGHMLPQDDPKKVRDWIMTSVTRMIG